MRCSTLISWRCINRAGSGRMPGGGLTMSEIKRPTIHYTELEDLPPDNPLYREWVTYRREVPRLLAEGHEGKFALVKGTQLLGVYQTDNEATVEGYRRFLRESFL